MRRLLYKRTVRYTHRSTLLHTRLPTEYQTVSDADDAARSPVSRDAATLLLAEYLQGVVLVVGVERRERCPAFLRRGRTEIDVQVRLHHQLVEDVGDVEIVLGRGLHVPVVPVDVHRALDGHPLEGPSLVRHVALIADDDDRRQLVLLLVDDLFPEPLHLVERRRVVDAVDEHEGVGRRDGQPPHRREGVGPRRVENVEHERAAVVLVEDLAVELLDGRLVLGVELGVQELRDDAGLADAGRAHHCHPVVCLERTAQVRRLALGARPMCPRPRHVYCCCWSSHVDCHSPRVQIYSRARRSAIARLSAEAGRSRSLSTTTSGDRAGAAYISVDTAPTSRN